jgi:ABC-type Co2+ transport system permease subunit
MYINFREILKRAIKYLVEGLIVSLAAFAIPKKSLDIEEIVIIALVAAATFSILDTYIPSIANSARQGTGLGIGFGLSGFGAGLAI